MDKVARLPAAFRRDIFSEAGARVGIRPTIIEKDFWVCVALKRLFQKSRFARSLVFKGGTSPSKAHGLIERFSEDIDLFLDWTLIGFGDGLRNPMQDFASKCQSDLGDPRSFVGRPPFEAGSGDRMRTAEYERGFRFSA